jgi:hypothetical protein
MKKNRILRSTFLTVLLVATQSMYADWQNTNCPGRIILSLAVNGTNLFAGTSGTNPNGIYFSPDYGASWTQVSTGLTDKIIEAIAVSGTNLFAGPNLEGVFLSTNNGASWNPTGLTEEDVRSFAVRGKYLFAGTNNHGVFLSKDDGANWTAVNSGLVNHNIHAIVVSGTNLFAGTSGTNGGGVFRSIDSGMSWTSVNTGLPVINGELIASLAVSGATIFAGTYARGVFLSTDNGANWNSVSSGLPIDAIIKCLAIKGSNIFAGTGGINLNQSLYFYGVFLSTDNGASWTPFNTGLPTDMEVVSLAIIGTDLFAGTGGSGVWRRSLSELGINTVLDAPTLVAPSNCATNQPSNVTLQWNARADASTYRVQVSTNPDFSGAIVDDSSVTDTFKVIGPLSGYGAMAFYWRVRAKNAAAASCDWSRPWAFSTGTPVLLDDFEDGDNANKIGTYWYFWADSNSTIHNAGSNKDFTGGYTPGNGSTYAGIMDFTVRGSGVPEAEMGFNFDAAGDSVDLSGAKAVQFDVKGNRPMYIQLRISQATIHDYNYYNAKIGVDTSWKTVLVSLSKCFGGLSQEPWGDTAAFAINKLTSLQWVFRPRDGADPDSSGKISIDNVKLIGSPAGLHAPFAPLVIGPAWGAAKQSLSPLIKWRSSAGATSYRLQLSKSQTFASFVVNQSGITDTSYQISGLDTGAIYYWRVNATGGGLTSRWSNATSFTTIGKSAIIVNPGWNMISLNIHPWDSSAQSIFGSLRGFVLAKNNAGLVYWPVQGINSIGSLGTGNGYKVYTDSLDTLRPAGASIDVATTPISLSAGWNMAAYLPQSNLSIVTALSGVASQISLVKDNMGQVYLPDYNINNIGDMLVGEGYKIYMKNAAVLTYPSGGIPKMLAEGKNCRPPLPGHYLYKRKTGNNATILAKQVTIDGALAADNSEIGAFNEEGNLVGGGVVMKGTVAFSVWGDDPQTKEKDGCATGEEISFKLWNGVQEFPIVSQGSELINYKEDGIYTAMLSARGGLSIKNFALRTAASNPFRNRIKVLFDVPAINGKDAQEVEINIFGLNGRLVHQLVKGKYPTGHYSATWNADGDASSGSNLYIVRMKAAAFNNEIIAFQVK